MNQIEKANTGKETENSDDSQSVDESNEKQTSQPEIKLKFMPNKKRFIILSVIFSIIELTGLLIFAYSFTKTFEGSLYEFGIFIIAPFTAVALSYFCDNKKEALAISSINAFSSLIIYTIIFIIVEKFVEFPEQLEFNYLSFIGIPLVFACLQVAVAYSLVRFRKLLSTYSDSKRLHVGDKELIEDLQKNRENREKKAELNSKSETEKINDNK